MQGLKAEIIAFLAAFLSGMTVACAYVCIRKLRRVIRHSPAAVAAEDAAYWVGAAIYLFMQIYSTGNGDIRWYFVVGALLGLAAFLLCGRLFRKIGMACMKKRNEKSGKTIEIQGKTR